jgi:hypothetical protein
MIPQSQEWQNGSSGNDAGKDGVAVISHEVSVKASVIMHVRGNRPAHIYKGD